MALKEVRWTEGGSQSADDDTLFYGSGNANHHLGTCPSYIKKSHQLLTRVKFISDRMSCTVLRCRWSGIIFLNVYAPNKYKMDDTMDTF
jgi:hypothetical protein